MMTEQQFKEWLEKQGIENINSKTKYGETTAHMAARDCNLEALEFIAQHAPELLSKQNDIGGYPILYAENVETLKFLAEKAPETFNVQRLAYSAARHRGRYKIFEFLAQNHSETLSTQDEKGYTTAHYAVEEHNEIAINIIAQHAPETLSIKNQFGDTPTHIAVKKNLSHELYVIAQHAPETLSIKDKFGRTPAEYTRSPKILSVIAKFAPETLPIELFDKSKENNKLLKDVFKLMTNTMKERKDYFSKDLYYSKKDIKMCKDRIDKFNKVVDEKTNEYKQMHKKEKALAKNLEKLGKGE